ncbi:hypothetical protein PG5_01580 [Pseudomonas sp. G5(2012)]|nr:hypothetical protein PG5_01580 [Pseudomonas sp. G5(2012)]
MPGQARSGYSMITLEPYFATLSMKQLRQDKYAGTIQISHQPPTLQ